MSLRHAKAILVGAALIASATACGLVEGGGSDAPSPSPSGGGQTSGGAAPAGPKEPAALPVAGKATPQGQNGLTATVNSFKADGVGFGALTYTLKNTGSDDLTFSTNFDEDDNRTLSVQMGNVQVRDDSTKEIQYTLRDTDRSCLCYWNGPGWPFFTLKAGEEATFTNMYPISNEAQTVTVRLPGFDPVPGVKVERP